MLVTENRSKGVRFTRVRLVIGPGKEGVVYKTADFHKPWDIGVTPDAAIQAKIDDLNAQLAPIFNTVVGQVDGGRSRAPTHVRPRSDGPTACCESLDRRPRHGRDPHRRTATDFALTNSGGLRADLTCPAGAADPNARTSARASLYPVPDGAGQYPITRGQVLGVLPFGNVSATLTINGAELKDYLETAVSSLPATGNGRFGAGVGAVLHLRHPGHAGDVRRRTAIVTPGTGNRVLSAVRQAADGSCTGAAISFTRGDQLHADHERLHRRRRRRLPELPEPDDDAGHPRPGSRGLPRGRPGRRWSARRSSDRIHCTDPNPGVGTGLPGRLAVAEAI